MLKRKNFVSDMTKAMGGIMIIILTMQPAPTSIAQADKEKNKIDSVQKSIEIKEKISHQLESKGDDMFKVVIDNYDTLSRLKLKKQRVKIKKGKKEKERVVVTYKLVPIVIDSKDFKTFTAKFPSDTIPLKINVERIPKKKNIFNFLKRINKKNGRERKRKANSDNTEATE